MSIYFKIQHLCIAKSPNNANAKLKSDLNALKPNCRKGMVNNRPKSSIKYTTERLMSTKTHDLTNPNIYSNTERGFTESSGVNGGSKKQFRKAYNGFQGTKTIDYRSSDLSQYSKPPAKGSSRNKHQTEVAKTDKDVSETRSKYFNDKKSRYDKKRIPP